MANRLKPPMGFRQQIDTLEKRGLIISDKSLALETLSGFNYYTFSGYLHDFRKPASDNYIEGLTFEKVVNIIEFDQRFRNVLMYALEVIENRLKTKIAFNHAHSYGPDGYLDANNFRDVEKHARFLKRFHENVYQNRNLPFVKHHIMNYGGVLPIWVATELFTMGMLHHFYQNIPGTAQKEIAREFNTGPNQLKSWIECTTYLRNMIAHYMRLYNFKMQKTPVICNRNHKHVVATYRAFDIVYIMKFLFGDENKWNSFIVANIKELVGEYQLFVEPKCLGFFDAWESLLSFTDPEEQVAVTKEN